MATIDNFLNGAKMKKGDYGELIVKQYLHKKGINTMSNDEQVPHPFDFLMFAKRNGEWTLVMSDVKTKPKMRQYNGTGIDVADFNLYLYLQQKFGMEMYLYFVDDTLGKCYGNYLNDLTKEVKENGIVYPFTTRASSNKRDVIIFHMSNVKPAFDLDAEQISILKSLSTSEYDNGDYTQPMTPENQLRASEVYKNSKK